MYKTLVYFTDMQDNDYPYDEGDVFPRQGLSVNENRLKELSTTANRRGIQLIQLVEQEVKKEKLYTKTEINRMAISELRKLVKENNIEKTDEMNGSELKKILIAHFGL